MSTRSYIARGDAYGREELSYEHYTATAAGYFAGMHGTDMLGTDPTGFIEAAALAEYRGTVADVTLRDTNEWHERSVRGIHQLYTWGVTIDERRIAAITSFFHARSLIYRTIVDGGQDEALEEDAYGEAMLAVDSAACLDYDGSHDILYPEALRQRALLTVMEPHGGNTKFATRALRTAVAANQSIYNRYLPQRNMPQTFQQSMRRNAALSGIIATHRLGSYSKRVDYGRIVSALKLLD